MIYGYIRVSSIGQAKDGNSLEGQEQALRENGVTEIFSDTFTGTKTERPNFQKLLAVLDKGDTLIVTKLDRISRSASQGIALVDGLLAKGVSVHILNMGKMDNTPTGTLIRNIMFSFAQFERDMIVERTSEGKAIAKAHGKRVDGFEKRQLPDFEKFLKKQKDGLMTVNECCSALGISRRTWYNRVAEVTV